MGEADPEQRLAQARDRLEAALRGFDEAQEALGAAEDELAAAEAGREAAERHQPPVAADTQAGDRLEEAERVWQVRMREADKADERRSEAEDDVTDAESGPDGP